MAIKHPYTVSAPTTYTLAELEDESGFDKRTISYYISEGLLPKVGRRGPKTTYPQEFHDRLMFIRRMRDMQDAAKLRAVTLKEMAALMRRLSAEQFRSVAEGALTDEWIHDQIEEPDWDTTAYAIPAERVAADERGDLKEAVERMDFDEARMQVGMASARSRRDRLQRRGSSAKEARSVDSFAPYEPQTELSMMENVALQIDDDRQLPELIQKLQANLAEAQDRQERLRQLEDLQRQFERLGALFHEVQDRARMGAKRNRAATRETLVRVKITDDILLSVRNIDDEHAELVEEIAHLIRRLGEL